MYARLEISLIRCSGERCEVKLSGFPVLAPRKRNKHSVVQAPQHTFTQHMLYSQKQVQENGL